MLGLLLPILLSAISMADEGSKATDAELRRAHELLSGSWEFISLTDKGETLGRKLVETRFAQDGILDIADRRMTIVNPQSGEKRTATYRIDPSTNPRRIDLITGNDRIFHGIYKFDDDALILCLQPGESGTVPQSFSPPDDTDLILVRLKAKSRRPSLSGDTSLISRNETKAEPSRDPRPSEGSLRRAHELLAGSWDILAITDDGEALGPELIRAKFAKNGRVEIGNRSLAIVSPKAGERRISTIRIDPSKTPSEIDVTTQFDEVLKGIYQFRGDELVLCVAKREDDDRPTDFTAPTGSDAALLRLKMAPSELPTTTVGTLPAKSATPPADSYQQKEARIKQKIVGAWSHNDSKGNLALVFHADGSFIVTRTWKSGLKKIFEGDKTTSQGRWTYQGGLLDLFVTDTMDLRLLARKYDFYLQSIGDNTMVVKDLFGELKTAQRLR
jgi:uncharacterized protein (TIGR03067 family)